MKALFIFILLLTPIFLDDAEETLLKMLSSLPLDVVSQIISCFFKRDFIEIGKLVINNYNGTKFYEFLKNKDFQHEYKK